MDIRSRQGMLNAMVGRVGKRMDTLLIPLELLCCISRTEFPDKKAYIRWQKRQVNSYSLSFWSYLFDFSFLDGALCHFMYLLPPSHLDFVCLVEYAGGGAYKSSSCGIW